MNNISDKDAMRKRFEIAIQAKYASKLIFARFNPNPEFYEDEALNDWWDVWQACEAQYEQVGFIGNLTFDPFVVKKISKQKLLASDIPLFARKEIQ